MRIKENRKLIGKNNSDFVLIVQGPLKVFQNMEFFVEISII